MNLRKENSFRFSLALNHANNISLTALLDQCLSTSITLEEVFLYLNSDLNHRVTCSTMLKLNHNLRFMNESCSAIALVTLVAEFLNLLVLYLAVFVASVFPAVKIK